MMVDRIIRSVYLIYIDLCAFNFYFHERDDNKSVNENIIKIVHNSKQILKFLQCIVSNINYINMVGMNTLQN